ncbi:alpha-mannosidase [Metabacillus arenae]|uniref:Alpha-mannosidase n=1 Tax=Metabacillus arenae TaxID=2771434 RepID=A0A926NJ29_9BACI|nr:alpha-mannosidase [Metabacillus arenae]MBD1382271.1 alpha-mannosidase [Metabacillus arenae]
MFLTIEMVQSRIGELEKYRYRDSISIPSFESQVDVEGIIGKYPPEDGEWDTLKVGEKWVGRDLYLWLKTEVEVPSEWKGKKIVGRFDFGRTGSGNNSGFESLLYLNGHPYQGVDSNHTEVFLPSDLLGEKIKLQFRLWSGLEGGGEPKLQENQLKLAELTWLDEITDDFYYTTKAIYETIQMLDESQAVYHQLVKLLNYSYRRLDWSRPGSDSFYQSVREGHDYLHAELNKIEKHHEVTVHCIGHTHIDVAWLWRLKHTREKSARSFSTVLRLMELYPEYIFLQTQPQLYEYIKEDYPEIYEQIKERVKESRWEASGGMWLEADCNIPSGESLTRQILLGTKFLRNEFGQECHYLWLPDVFGYSWALPQILKKSGIDTFMTTKISWSQYNRMPHDTFYWRGIDGSEVLTHFITTPDPEISWLYTYNGMITPQTVKGIWETYRDKSVNQDLLLSYGFGDGGGGVNREMLEMRRRLDEIPGIPFVKTTRADEYFEKLQNNVANIEEYVHTWDGELYLEYHRGTYTSQAHVKRMNRKLELLYRETEWLASLSSIFDTNWRSYPEDALNTGWKMILRNQFHDIIPGSSIREVYEDAVEEYEEALQIGQQSWNLAARNVAGESIGKTYTIYNSAPWERTDLVRIEATSDMEEGIWVDSAGKHLLAENVENKWLVKVPRVPSMGFTTISFVPQQLTYRYERAFIIETNCLTTPFYVIQWNDQGQLVRIYDRKTEREILVDNAKGNVFQVFEDKPLRHDAWDIDLFYQQKMREVSDLKGIEIEEVNSLRAVVAFKWEYNDSIIIQKVVVYSGSRRIDFETEVDWHEQQQLLKVAFPVDIRATEATYDIQYGNVKRPTHWNTSWDYARFETVGHQWADLSEHGYGVSLLNDCKYGYDIKNHVMRLTLIKSAIHPDYLQDQGKHVFTYSLLPHQGNWIEGKTVQEAWSLNAPLKLSAGKPQRMSVERFSSFTLDCPNVMIDAVKKAEDEDKLILRLHEYTGSRGKINITSDLPIVSWQETNLLEKPVGEKVGSTFLSFSIKPYEIKTFMIELSNK